MYGESPGIGRITVRGAGVTQRGNASNRTNMDNEEEACDFCGGRTSLVGCCLVAKEKNQGILSLKGELEHMQLQADCWLEVAHLAEEKSERLKDQLSDSESVRRELASALKDMMDWIGPPPTDRSSYDSFREEAWRKAKEALKEGKNTL
jgi:hypothetical protein